MPAARDDYLIRMIQQIAAVLRRLRERLVGGAPAHEVIREAGSAIGTLLGPQHALLDRLDPMSAVRLVGNPDTVRAWIDLLHLQGEAAAVAGDAPSSAAYGARADSLSAALDAATSATSR